jgi:hypothetical protein
MAQSTNTFDTYDTSLLREQLSDVIENIAPYERPFLSNIGRTTVAGRYEEWAEDTLATASTSNAVIEGDEAGYDAVTPAVRYGNYTQIFDQTLIISGTAQKVDVAGSENTFAYQLAKKGKELMNDVEATLVGNQPAALGANNSARKAAGFEAFLRTNVSRGAGGQSATLSGTTNGFPNAYPVNGTARAFTETLLKTVITSLWTNGGTPKICIVGAFNKKAASAFTGIAEIRKQVPGAEQATVIGAADVYVSDFGNVTFVPSRFSHAESALLVDPEYVSLGVLRPLMTNDLAKVGDADRKQLLMEATLKVSAEKAHGIVADLTTA